MLNLYEHVFFYVYVMFEYNDEYDQDSPFFDVIDWPRSFWSNPLCLSTTLCPCTWNLSLHGGLCSADSTEANPAKDRRVPRWTVVVAGANVAFCSCWCVAWPPSETNLVFFELLFWIVDLNLLFLIARYTILLLESKIIVHSTHTWLVTLFVESMQLLLFPLTWENVYIPLCPAPMVELVDAPVPYLLGMCTTDAEQLLNVPNDVYVCRMHVGCWLLLVVGCWLLVVGCCWLLVVGCWLLLVVGCWLLVVLVWCCVYEACWWYSWCNFQWRQY